MAESKLTQKKKLEETLSLDDQAHILSSEQQFEIQKRDLYKRAMSGDMTAKRMWLELYGAEESIQTFNVNVKVTPYRIKDPSLRLIVTEAEPETVDEILIGLKTRLSIDEAPDELQKELINFMEHFEKWATIQYRAKNA